MTFSIKNWKLAILALLLISLFIYLGCWQLARARYKTALLQSFKIRESLPPITAATLLQLKDPRFYRTKLVGKFDNAHTFLLDNKTFHGHVGYEVYTPFQAKGLIQPILIDRGFIPLGAKRSTLPAIPAITGDITLVGMINLPPRYVAFAKIYDSLPLAWPLRIEFMDLNKLSELLHTPLFPYLFILSPNDKIAFATEWQIVIMPPERHQGYAVQWFALALTLLILFVALNCNRSPK